MFIIVFVLMAFIAQGQAGKKSKDKNKDNTAGPALTTQQKPQEPPPKREKCCKWMAAVKVYKNWGYIDTNGVYQINLQFDDAENFSDGLARVRKMGE